MVSAWAMSLGVHVMIAAGTAAAGRAVGVEEGLAGLMAVLPVVMFSGAVPLLPSGVGVMEGAAVLLLDEPMGRVIGMMLVFRLYQLTVALVGGGVMVRGGFHLHEISDEAEEASGG